MNKIMNKIDIYAVTMLIIGGIATACSLSLMLGGLPKHNQTEIKAHQEYLNENPHCGFVYTENGQTKKVLCADAEGNLHEPEYYFTENH